MNWESVSIVDKSGKAHSGKSAQTFVEVNCPGVATTTGKGAIIVKQKNGKSTIQPGPVKAVLIQKLRGLVSNLTIDSSAYITEPVVVFVPQKATVSPINIAPQYTITLELGDMDAIFEPIGGGSPWMETGVRQRLQALGYLYCPLNLPNTGRRDQWAKDCWEYYKMVHEGHEGRTLLDAELLTRLKDEIQNNLVAGSFPGSGEVLGAGAIPADGSYAAIRFPGGYRSTKGAASNVFAGDHKYNNGRDSGLPAKYNYIIGDSRHKLEDLVFEENPLLGRIPLITKVMKKVGGKPAVPAPNVPVYFQLIDPDDITGTDFCAPDPPDKVMNYGAGPTDPTEITGVGQKKFIEDMIGALVAAADPADPQRWNVPAKWCGKAQSPKGIAAVLETPTADQDGFHTKRPLQVKDYAPLLHAKVAADAAKDPHAVSCDTNAKGFAGVVFTPSRCGGDTYKLRVYLDPDWLRTEKAAPGGQSEVLTGTFVVWRNLRFYRHYKLAHPKAAQWSPTLQASLNFGTPPTKPRLQSPEFVGTNLDQDVIEVAVLPSTAREAGYPAKARPVNARAPLAEQYRPAATASSSFEDQLNWAYCELIQDCAGVEELDATAQARALAVGTRSFDNSQYAPPKRINWGQMILTDNTSPFLVTLRGFGEYNRVKGVGYPGLDSDSDDVGAPGWSMIEGIIEELAGGGLLPGLMLMQTPWADTWHERVHAIANLVTSGFGGASGAILNCTRGTYYPNFIYSATGNAIHELGHVLLLKHQPPVWDGDAAMHQDAVTTNLATPTASQVVCVMSYSGCYGELCGRCLLSLRGWGIKSQSNPAGA